MSNQTLDSLESLPVVDSEMVADSFGSEERLPASIFEDDFSCSEILAAQNGALRKAKANIVKFSAKQPKQPHISVGKVEDSEEFIQKISDEFVGLPKDAPTGCFHPELERVIEDVILACDSSRSTAMGFALGFLSASVAGQANIVLKKINPQPGNMWIAVSEPSGSGKSACGNFFYSRISHPCAASSWT